ncbi:otolith matrix protein OMM-64-like [Homalodisca vitripennis]|uniref:otolith matrix protein OMM-64-like n=1 Tax=Homalodisca vitripennis TaxID=197043 RepID=UPI001EECB23E|nr:otolith matrix protein OMM-64-like [Homalodisca vitripennis]
MYTFVVIFLCLLRITSTSPIVSELNYSTIVCEQDSSTSEIICKQSNGTTSEEDIDIIVPLCDTILDLRGNFSNCKMLVNLTEESENITQPLFSENDNSNVSEFLFDDDPTPEDQNNMNSGEGNDSTIRQNILNDYEDIAGPTLSSLTLSFELPVQTKRKDNTILEKAAIGDHIDDEDYYDTSEETEINESDLDNDNMTDDSKEEMEVSADAKINATESEETESFDGKENENLMNSASVEDDLPREEDTKDTIEENSNTELTNNEDLNTAKSEGKEVEEADNLDLSKEEETIPGETATAQSVDEPNSNKNSEDPWFWDWLFRSLMPQNNERMKRDENSHITSGTSDVDGTNYGTSEMEKRNGSQPINFMENSNEEDANKTITECIGEECDFDTGNIENETLTSENVVLESDQGETNMLNVWNTNKNGENTPWIEILKAYEKVENEGMTHLTDDGKNHTEFEPYELNSNKTVPEIELINIWPLKTSENYKELVIDVLLAKNTSQNEGMIHFQIQYGTVNLPVNTALLLRSALNELSEIGMEEQESGDEIILESVDEREINGTSENTGEMLNFVDLVGADNDTIYGILSSDTFVTFELHNKTINNNEIPLI